MFSGTEGWNEKRAKNSLTHSKVRTVLITFNSSTSCIISILPESWAKSLMRTWTRDWSERRCADSMPNLLVWSDNNVWVEDHVGNTPERVDDVVPDHEYCVNNFSLIETVFVVHSINHRLNRAFVRVTTASALQWCSFRHLKCPAEASSLSACLPGFQYGSDYQYGAFADRLHVPAYT